MTRKKYTPEQISRITGLSGGLSGLSGGFRQTGFLTGQTGLLRAVGMGSESSEWIPFPKGTPSGSGQAC